MQTRFNRELLLPDGIGQNERKNVNETVNFKIMVQYDGSRYNGWQLQKNTDNTIQGKIEKVLERMLGQHVDIIGSGRTDAGVHAKGQVANFHVPGKNVKEALKSIEDEKIRDLRDLGEDEALRECKKLREDEIPHNSKRLGEDDILVRFLEKLNSFLPEDIAITAIERVPSDFHARFDAVSKTYRYRIHTSNVSTVFERKYVYFYPELKLDLHAMKKACEFLKGEHDFKSFCANKHMKKSTVRTIYNIEIQENDKDVIIDYTGNGFLQGMVRILTGTLIEIGTGRKNPLDIVSILEAKNRETAGFTAPAEGLMLMEVKY